MTTRPLRPLLVAALLALAAGCGGDGEDTASEGTSSSPGASASATASPTPAPGLAEALASCGGLRADPVSVEEPLTQAEAAAAANPRFKPLHDSWLQYRSYSELAVSDGSDTSAEDAADIEASLSEIERQCRRVPGGAEAAGI